MQEISHVYIDGRFVEPHGTELFDLHNPATGEVFGRVRLGDVEDARAAIAAAKRAFPSWSRSRKTERIALLHRLYEVMDARKDALLDAIILEYGAPISRSTWMAAHAANSFLEAARTLEKFDLRRRIGTAEVIMEPVGVVGLITPWNSNAGFICSKLAYALAAGCTAVIKPSEMSAAQTQVVLEALHEASAPPGLFNIVNGRGDIVGAEITANPDISKISFTGSTAVGKAILRGAAETLKRVTLELGGKSPNIVFADSDIDNAVKGAISGIFYGKGEVCNAGSRLFLENKVKDEFTEKLVARASKMRPADPLDPKTRMGAIVSQEQMQTVLGYIEAGKRDGAKLLAGGNRVQVDGSKGFFIEPTIFGDVKNDMKVAQEEIFGPVLAVLTFDDVDEVIEQANDNPYGLAAAVWTRDVKKAHSVSRRLKAGTVWINTYGLMDASLPFGGYKSSGFGRELGANALEHYTEVKTVWLNMA